MNRPLKALIVDDTATIRSLIQVYLMSPALRFAEAADGTAGLARARELVPDLIISDVSMPGLDGFELCGAIRSDRALHAVPILLLTSLDDEETARKGRLAGANALLCKPVTVDKLRAAVRLLLPGALQ